MKVLSLVFNLILLVGLTLSLGMQVSHQHETLLEIASPEGFRLSPAGGGSALAPAHLTFDERGSSYLLNQEARFGIGTSSPWGLLSVSGVKGITSSTTPILVVGHSGTSTPHLLVHASGFTGIATSTPAQELSVVGNAFVGGTGTTTLFLDTSSASTGGCIQMRGATSSIVYRIYISEGGSNEVGGAVGAVALRIERGGCR